jgi:hypothetical protein
MLRRSLLGLSPLVLAWPALAAAPPAEGGKGGDSEVRFVRLPALTANILRSNRTQGVIALESGLYVADPKLRARIPMFVPRLRSDLNLRLALFMGRVPPGIPPNLDLLLPLLQRQVDKTIGQPGARFLVLNVLIN